MILDILLTNAGDSHQSAGFALLGAEGEQQVGTARGAEFRRADISGGNSGIEQLPAISFDEIEPEFGGQFAVSRSARSEKQERIAFVNLVGLLGFVKQAI